mmetsp:Transcript_33325/g.57066  ORF Transcript_33325/g.57066 Transcript_33325/m.57066 type:complete len:89 (-) Transcript_33325:32-298(-)
MMLHDVAGPLCFAGDLVARAVELPKLEVNDIVVLEEAGGNTLSMATSHCSRRRPPVYGYTRDVGSGALEIEAISRGTTIEQALAVWTD